MATDSTAAVQAALYGVLAADAGLSALNAGVYDHVPAGASFPYVTLGEMTAKPLGESGCDIVAALHVHSRAPGMKEAREVLSALDAALDGADFIVAGHSLVLCRRTDSETRIETDGITRRGTARFRIVTDSI